MSWRTNSMVAGGASEPAMSAAGSPGSRCSSRNTPTVARNRTGTACTNRRATKPITRQLAAFGPLSRLFRQPAPGVRAPIGREGFAFAEGLHGHQGVTAGERLVGGVGEFPVALDHVEDRNVSFPAAGQGAELVPQSQPTRGVGG